LSVTDYSAGLTAGPTFALGTNIINVKFSTDGLVAYANSGVSKRIYVIDAVNKVVTDSIDFAPESPASMEVSADNSKLFVTVTGKVRVYETTNYTAIDSTVITMPITSLYRHPTKPEIWCVHHFADSVSVFNMNPPYNLMDSIPVGGSPFYLAFGVYSMGVNELANSEDVRVYPNPAQDGITIELTFAKGELELYDSKGAMLQKQAIYSKTQTLNISELPAGLYFVSARDASGKRSIARFNKL
jgi:DNA-binding beta-propeller fold protein YncE